jgi:hypothetical protein
LVHELFPGWLPTAMHALQEPRALPDIEFTNEAGEKFTP